MRIRLVVETVLAAAIAFCGTLGPLTQSGLTAAEWLAATVAGLTSALALIRQQPARKA